MSEKGRLQMRILFALVVYCSVLLTCCAEALAQRPQRFTPQGRLGGLLPRDPSPVRNIPPVKTRPTHLNANVPPTQTKPLSLLPPPTASMPRTSSPLLPPPNAPIDLMTIMRKLEHTYRQQAILIGKLMPHAPLERQSELRDAIKRAQSSRNQLLAQIEQLKDSPGTSPFQTNKAANQVAANAAAKQREPKKLRVRVPAPSPTSSAIQTAANERVPPQPFTMPSVDASSIQSLFHEQESSEPRTHSANVIPTTIPMRQPPLP